MAVAEEKAEDVEGVDARGQAGSRKVHCRPRPRRCLRGAGQGQQLVDGGERGARVGRLARQDGLHDAREAGGPTGHLKTQN